MPAFMPGVQPFAVMQGTYSLSADQETATLSAADCVTPWFDCTTTLAKYSHSGTATGAYGRTSAAKPPRLDDSILILPGAQASSVWTRQINPNSGSNPASQGWSLGGSPSTNTYSGISTSYNRDQICVSASNCSTRECISTTTNSSISASNSCTRKCVRNDTRT
jgi:hypothetical protein